MGIDGVVNTIARVVSPIVMGEVYRRTGAGVAFGIANAAVLFASSAIALIIDSTNDCFTGSANT